MKREELLGIRYKKFENFSEWFSEVVEKCGLADIRYPVQGFIVHKPWSFFVIRKIIQAFEEELEKRGHEAVLFPLVIPEENLVKEKEHTGFKPQVFFVTEAGEKRLSRRLALRPTSETAIYPIFSLWIQSYTDLPLKIYQTVTVYRYESVTRPFIRGREFIFIEAHDAFREHEDALKQIKEDMEISREVITNRLAIPFLYFKRPPWDKFKGAEDTYAADTIMPDGRSFQIASTHDLGQRFSKAFDIKFVDRDGKWKYVWQTCYGPGVWRIFAALVSIHGDDKGLIYPFEFSPIQIVVIPIFYSDDEKKKVLDKCSIIARKLREFRVKVDDSEKTPGEKFNHWEMLGVPFRVEIGINEVNGNFVTVFRRDNFSRIKVEDDKLVERILELSKDMLRSLRERAEKFFQSMISEAHSKEDLIKLMNEKKGFIRVNFCNREECAMKLKEETNGMEVRGTLAEKIEEPRGKCIWCGRKAKAVVYLAKPY